MVGLNFGIQVKCYSLLVVVAKVSAVVGRSLADAALRNDPPKLSARFIVGCNI